jgi:ABC-type multidrug transport system ATPase subunit
VSIVTQNIVHLCSGVTSTGSITYNGHTFDEFIAQRTASYVSQTDTHIGELTVRETFDFAARIQGSGARESEWNVLGVIVGIWAPMLVREE